MELLENTRLYKYVIELIDGKQSSYGPIYTLSQVELETLKIYIKTYLKIEFIQHFKSPVDVLILFDKKSDDNLCLCVDYESLNNLLIKKQYLLPLIGETLDLLDWAK